MFPDMLVVAAAVKRRVHVNLILHIFPQLIKLLLTLILP